MKRLIYDRLINWKKEDNPLPILLYGARQVGKTYIIKKFAEEFFPGKHIYINFFLDELMNRELQNVTSPQKIISIIENHMNVRIDDSWLLVFDEVQEVPTLKTALKLFVDLGIKQKIICTGSYLGNTLNVKDKSFPVGKVNIWTMYPMNFKEYLMALGKDKYITLIQKSIDTLTPLPKFEHNMIIDYMHKYMFNGGMPAVVQSEIENRTEGEIRDIKEQIYIGYKNDVSKYLGSASERAKCLSVYENLTTFFSREHNKFMLSQLDSSARYLNYESAIRNLLISKVVYKINNLKKPTIPLMCSQNESQFKLYFNDCGFISYLFRMNMIAFSGKDNQYANQRGAIAENFVINEFVSTINNSDLYYYSFRGNESEQDNETYKRSNSNTRYEVDLLMESEQLKLIPIEIKFGCKYSIASLNKMMQCNNIDYAIIFSSNNINYDAKSNIVELPLYCAGFIDINLNRINLKINKN